MQELTAVDPVEAVVFPGEHAIAMPALFKNQKPTSAMHAEFVVFPVAMAVVVVPAGQAPSLAASAAPALPK
jgi:hypothetical protein